jgi:hypothetical protein
LSVLGHTNIGDRTDARQPSGAEPDIGGSKLSGHTDRAELRHKRIPLGLTDRNPEVKEVAMHDNQRSTSLTMSFPGLGPALVLPVLLALLHQYWLSVGTFAAILSVSAIHSRMIVRTQRDQEETIRAREQAILTYAHTVTAFGQDPAPLIAAMKSLSHATQDGAYIVREDAPGSRPHLPARGRW